MASVESHAIEERDNEYESTEFNLDGTISSENIDDVSSPGGTEENRDVEVLSRELNSAVSSNFIRDEGICLWSKEYELYLREVNKSLMQDSSNKGSPQYINNSSSNQSVNQFQLDQNEITDVFNALNTLSPFSEGVQLHDLSSELKMSSRSFDLGNQQRKAPGKNDLILKEKERELEEKMLEIERQSIQLEHDKLESRKALQDAERVKNELQIMFNKNQDVLRQRADLEEKERILNKRELEIDKIGRMKNVLENTKLELEKLNETRKQADNERQELDNRWKAFDLNRDKVENLQKQLTQSKTENDILKDEISELRNLALSTKALEDKAKLLEKRENKLSKDKEAVDEARQSKRKCEQVVKACSVEIRSAMETKEEASQVVRHLEIIESRLNKKETALKSREKQLQDNEKKLGMLETKEKEIIAKEKEIKSLLQENDMLKSSLATRKETETSLRTREIELNREKLLVSGNLRELEAAKLSLETREERLELATQSNKRREEDLSAKIAELEKTIQKLSDERHEQNKMIFEMKRERNIMVKKTRSLEKIQQEKHDLEKLLEQKNAKLGELKNQVTHLRDEVNSHVDKTVQEKELVKNIEGKFLEGSALEKRLQFIEDNLKKEIKHLRESLDRRSQRVSNLKEQLRRKEEESTATIDQLRLEKQSLDIKLLKLTADRLEEESQRRQLKAQVEKLESEKARNRVRNAELSERMKLLEERILSNADKFARKMVATQSAIQKHNKKKDEAKVHRLVNTSTSTPAQMVRTHEVAVESSSAEIMEKNVELVAETPQKSQIPIDKTMYQVDRGISTEPKSLSDSCTQSMKQAPSPRPISLDDVFNSKRAKNAKEPIPTSKKQHNINNFEGVVSRAKSGRQLLADSIIRRESAEEIKNVEVETPLLAETQKTVKQEQNVEATADEANALVAAHELFPKNNEEDWKKIIEEQKSTIQMSLEAYKLEFKRIESFVVSVKGRIDRLSNLMQDSDEKQGEVLAKYQKLSEWISRCSFKIDNAQSNLQDLDNVLLKPSASQIESELRAKDCELRLQDLVSAVRQAKDAYVALEEELQVQMNKVHLDMINTKPRTESASRENRKSSSDFSDLLHVPSIASLEVDGVELSEEPQQAGTILSHARINSSINKFNNLIKYREKLVDDLSDSNTQASLADLTSFDSQDRHSSFNRDEAASTNSEVNHADLENSHSFLNAQQSSVREQKPATPLLSEFKTTGKAATTNVTHTKQEFMKEVMPTNLSSVDTIEQEKNKLTLKLQQMSLDLALAEEDDERDQLLANVNEVKEKLKNLPKADL